MRLTTTKLWILRASVVLAPLSAALFASCTGKGPPRPTCDDFADAGAIDAAAITPYTEITTDARAPTEFGMEPDHGPQCTRGNQDDELEIMQVADFENGYAPAWFKYGESGILIDPLAAGEGLDTSGEPNTFESPPPPYWGLQVQALAQAPGGERCGSKYALHMVGARFSSWGGGYVTRLAVVREPYIDRFCDVGSAESLSASRAGKGLRNGIGTAPRYMTAVETGEMVDRDAASGCFFFMSPADGQPSLLGIDVSEFDGISFWARRGADGQATLRVGLIDDSVSEALALSVERIAYEDAGTPPDQAGARCERVKECCRGCREFEHDEYLRELTIMDDGAERAADVVPAKDKRCHVEGERMPHIQKSGDVVYMWDFRESECGDVPTYLPGEGACWTSDQEASQVWDTWNRDHALCCPRSMEDEWADPAQVRNGDPRFGTGESGVECSPYVFLYDHSSGYYCHTEGDVLPEKNQNRCDEGFETAVVLDTEWELYTVPWKELRRSTPDKPQLNPKGIWQIAFYFSSGYLDTYVDDIGFYKRRPR